MKINVFSETKILNIKGEGVNASFLDHIELLKEQNDVEICINNESIGDILHSHTYGPYYFWRGRKYKHKKIFTVHTTQDTIKGSLPFWKLAMPFVKWYFKQVFSYADVCIAISPMVEKTIKDSGARTTIYRLNNPVMLEKWLRNSELRKKGRAILGLKENEFCVLGVGQLEARKGCEDFIEVAKLIPDAQFRWVGGRPLGAFTEGIRKLNRQIRETPDNVIFAGMYEYADMPCLYAAADVFLFPSYQENCPLAPVEAAASGMPVIFRDLIEYNMLYQSPYLKANSIPEFAALIEQLKSDNNAYEHGLDVSAQLIKQFDRTVIRSKLLELYSSFPIKTDSTGVTKLKSRKIYNQPSKNYPQVQI
ncbi:MAG: glycosyltransferase family 4 protein [Saprospiraceae bacterium]